jgi:hypothetical protein
VITLKWSKDLAENLKGMKESLKGIKQSLDGIKDEAVRKKLQELIQKLEAESIAQPGHDRVVKVELASGKLEGGSKSR